MVRNKETNDFRVVVNHGPIRDRIGLSLRPPASIGDVLSFSFSVLLLVLPRLEKICVSIEVLLLDLGCYRLRAPIEVT